MKRQNYHHGNLRAALIEAGIALLNEQGLPGLSLRAIAARVGVSHTAPKNHFGSLKGLLTAIATEGFRRHAAAMRKGVSDTSLGADRVRAALAGYVEFAEAHPALFEMMFSPLYCDYQDDALIAQARESYAVLEDVAATLAQGQDVPHSQLRTEMMLWSFAHGFASLRLAGQFRDGTEGLPRFGITDVLPDFEDLYRASRAKRAD
jgi:AcrR family transcriptional regulator